MKPNSQLGPAYRRTQHKVEVTNQHINSSKICALTSCIACILGFTHVGMHYHGPHSGLSLILSKRSNLGPVYVLDRHLLEVKSEGEECDFSRCNDKWNIE